MGVARAVAVALVSSDSVKQTRPPATAAAVANWTRVENGLIITVNLTFDPRGILVASARSAGVAGDTLAR